MKVAVVGAAGFIGSHVMEYLTDEGHEAIGYDTELNDYVQEAIDVRWWAPTVTLALSIHKPDAIIGLAGILGTHELFDNVEQAIKVNVLGQYNVAWAAMKLGVPYVTIEQPHVWTNPYETTRGAGVRLARGLAEHKGLRLATVQAFNAFGPRQAYGRGHPQKIVPTFSVAGWNKAPFPIYGQGDQMVNLVTARDIARVMVAAIDHASTAAPHFWGAAIGGNMTVNRVADLIRTHTRTSEIPFEYADMRSGETDDGWGAHAEGRRLELQAEMLGVMPRFELTDLHETVNSYKGIPL